jgi:hypothetical protein
VPLDPEKWERVPPGSPIAVSEMLTAGITDMSGDLWVPLPRPPEVYAANPNLDFLPFLVEFLRVASGDERGAG